MNRKPVIKEEFVFPEHPDVKVTGICFNEKQLKETLQSIADYPIFAFVGRSNVGKSSFINYLANRKGIAKTSGIPGKTASCNFYNFNNQFILVDLPGIGYTKLKIHAFSFSTLVDHFISLCNDIRGFFFMVDARHPGLKMDLFTLDWLRKQNSFFWLILNKIDKIPKNKRIHQKKIFAENFEIICPHSILSVSSLKKEGRNKFLNLLLKHISQDLSFNCQSNQN
ncbi:ribosome biogenesis GTP-binding protein YihA/YsxC [Candidatus Riflebacteria bacterium]